MEGNRESSECRNSVLSQSYIQGVERVAQRDKRDPDIGFSLPEEVVQRRQKDWSKLFDKYTNEVSNDVELDMLTMQAVENETNEKEEEEEGENEDDEDENNGEEKEYYSKCRAPIRKLPALIQYWVDTGNPPYQLTGNEDHSDTGSSLSEGEYSRSNESAALRKSIENPKFDENSPYSSVDTAAYVLSNANVTKKAKTLEIVEGAKASNEKLSSKPATPLREDPNVTIATDKFSGQSAHCRSNESPKTPPGQQPQLNCVPTPGSSVMLSEVLPALQQFDDLLEKSKKPKPQRSALSKVRRIKKQSVAMPKAKEIVADHPALQSEQVSLETTNESMRTTNRRKLYTGRNSPCDLIMIENASNSLTTGSATHPALEPADLTKNLANRVRVRRKRKRSSIPPTITMSELLQSVIRTTSQKNREPTQDDTNNNNNNNNNVKEGHERYTHFFESLGLTPKKTSNDNNDDKIEPRPRTKRSLCLEMNDENGDTSRCLESQESSESFMKETESSSSQDPPRDIVSNSTKKATEILGNKILTIRVTRLTDDVLARYGHQTSESSGGWFESSSADHDNLNIEVLTTATNDSDSSTIIIYSCPQIDSDQFYDSDASSSRKNSSPSTSEPENAKQIVDSQKGKSCFSDKRVSAATNAGRSFFTKTTNSSPIEASPKTSPELSETCKSRKLVVKLEKMPLDLQRYIRKSKIAVESKPRDSRAENLDNSLPLGPTDPKENCTSRKGPGPRKTDVAKEIKKPKRVQKHQFSFGFNFRTPAEGDDDFFVKLTQKNVSTPLKTTGKSENSGTLTSPETASGETNGERQGNHEKVQKLNSTIAKSSDEEVDDPLPFSRKFQSRKRPRTVDTKVVNEAVKPSKNGRKITEESMDDANNTNAESIGSKNSRNDNFRRSRRKKTASSWFNGAFDAKNSSGESSGCARILDIRKNKKSADFSEDLIESSPKNSKSSVKLNFIDGKREFIEPERSRETEKSEELRSLRFCTRLSFDSDSNFDNVSVEKKIVASNKKFTKNKTILPKNNSIDKLEKRITKLNHLSRSKKKSSAIFDNEFISNNQVSLRRNSRKTLGVPYPRIKNTKKPRPKESATKKTRRTRIFRKPIDFETDDDDSEEPKIISGTSSREQSSPIKEKTSKRLENESISSEKPPDYLQHFFPHIPDRPIQNIDNIFASNDKQKISNKSINKTAKQIANANSINTRKATITFRTKLTSDSENDTDL